MSLKASPKHKLPVLYLLDSICKNVGGRYVTQFEKDIVALFSHSFMSVDSKTQRDLIKLMKTWSPIFSTNIMSEIEDVILEHNKPLSRQDVQRVAQPYILPSRELKKAVKSTNSIEEMIQRRKRETENFHASSFDEGKNNNNINDLLHNSKLITSSPELMHEFIYCNKSILGPISENLISLINDPKSQFQVMALIRQLVPSNSPSPAILLEALAKINSLIPSSKKNEEEINKVITKPLKSLAEISLISLNLAELSKNVDFDAALMYDAMPLQCKNCAFRFNDDDQGRIRMTNRAKTAISRGWFLDENDWVTLIDSSERLPFEISPEDLFSLHKNADEKLEQEATLGNDFFVSAGEIAEKCNFCKERLLKEWSDRFDDWNIQEDLKDFDYNII
ncbi:ENTH/VHS domain-containing protein [Rozella allomycis CSF55]|uniref:ENTH/VHS domain-containing protein n=1 Tax=Rozella allomycis (strain CSF55) TaxID=988480 RepID=A0A075AVR9_ROZAC|nr:ENTH/VHS domain-containing protein [Rozella allomycis CSF55]|eukprot:EPZ34423.1 ENTH/VHS domain-containing protein [Rozella allomycis CSF55]